MDRLPKPVRPVRWVASSRRDFRAFPDAVQDRFGFELFLAQSGLEPPSAKRLKGITPAVVELIEDHDGDTFRAVYTVKLEGAVYVLHAFMKKSKRGIATPKSDLDLIRLRLAAAEVDAARRRQDER